jgi:hypothetical protein
MQSKAWRVAVIDVQLVDDRVNEDLIIAPRPKSQILSATKVVKVLLTLET